MEEAGSRAMRWYSVPQFPEINFDYRIDGGESLNNFTNFLSAHPDIADTNKRNSKANN